MLAPELDVLDLATSLRFDVGVLEFRVLFVLADPDGYLWRPFQDLGERLLPSERRPQA